MNKKMKRARTRKGTYKADNPKTPTINEAYVASILEGYQNTMKNYWHDPLLPTCLIQGELWMSH